MSEILRAYGYNLPLIGICGGTQVVTESINIFRGRGLEKFPTGFSSMNILEEFAEGSIAGFVGATIGLISYRIAAKGLKWNYNPQVELSFMFAGIGLGYASMVIGGGFLHTAMGVPDVKWGPFK